MSDEEELEDIDDALDEEDIEAEDGDEQAQEAFMRLSESKYNSIGKARELLGLRTKRNG